MCTKFAISINVKFLRTPAKLMLNFSVAGYEKLLVPLKFEQEMKYPKKYPFTVPSTAHPSLTLSIGGSTLADARRMPPQGSRFFHFDIQILKT